MELADTANHSDDRATMRVLLIEDSPEDVALIRRELGRDPRASIQLVRAASLAEGLETLQRDSFAAVLLDLHLPDSEPESTLAAVLTGADPQPPVVVLTSFDSDEAGEAAVRRGAEDYLSKTQIRGDTLRRALMYAVERHRNRQQLQRYADELERSNREFAQFAHVVSHDLKSPLASALAACNLVEWALPDAPSEQLRQRLDQLRATLTSVRHLIDQLLAYARVGQGDPEANPQDLDSVLQTVTQNLHAAIQSTQAAIQWSALPQVTGHASHLVQLFQNVIENALKYRGSAAPRIEVTATLLDDEWQFRVRDNGRGIPSRELVRVFDLFERGAHAGAGPASGAGLGLATCQRIVERYGGRIWIESQEGQGTSVCWTWPRPAGE